jgi:hypothetical protein
MFEPTFVTPAVAPSVLRTLFLRYVSGEISEISWSEFMSAFDTVNASSDEREAFARFYNDAVHDLGADKVRVPKQEELEELLSATRVS